VTHGPAGGRLRRAVRLHPGLECFLYSLVFIQEELSKTLSVGVLTELVRGDISFWGSLMAACLTGSIPIIGVYMLCMDYDVSGLMAGAIK
jgi:multiple sugar transport system permease protein